MGTRYPVPIKFEIEKCSGCGICYSICPFEAISRNGEKIKINFEKCQLCGMCSSICPSSTIKTDYYDYESLISEVKKKKQESDADKLLLMCRGAIPHFCDSIDVLKEGDSEFLTMRLPCVGRLKTEFYLQSLAAGFKKIITVQCTGDSCHYRKGSHFNKVRTLELKELLGEMGYGDVIEIIEHSHEIKYNPERCVGCDKCVYICPYDAIEAQPLSTPKIHPKKCKKCGLCTIICPHLGLQIEDFETENISSAISSYSKNVKELKNKGVSPVILVFCCQWAEFSALDNLENGFLRENVALIEIPCFSSLNPSHIAQALKSGFDGVLAVVCSDEDCQSKESRRETDESFDVLNLALRRLNLENRFSVIKTHPRYLKSFDENIDLFLKVVEVL